MKKRLLWLMMVMLSSMAAWSADGDTFTANTIEGVEMSFIVISENENTCKTYGYATTNGNTTVYTPAISKDVTGEITIPAIVNGYNVVGIGSNSFTGTKVSSVIIPNGVCHIESGAFTSATILQSVYLPETLQSIGTGAFWGCQGLLSVDIPRSVERIECNAFQGCSSLQEVTLHQGELKYIGSAVFGSCKITSIIIPEGVETIGNAEENTNALFGNCWDLEYISLPSSLTKIDCYFYSYISSKYTSLRSKLERIEVHSPNVTTSYPLLSCSTFPEPLFETVELYVPMGSKTSYKAANNWKDFKEIIEMGDDITIGAAGMGTYCSTHALDFSGIDDIKAYIVSAFKPSTGEVTLTRITDVPANTGIVVKGDADTYAIPWGLGETIVSNMLVGVTENTVLNKVDGAYTNYILAKKNGNLGFYAVTDGSTLSAGKAYLPLPTASLPSGSRGMKFVFGDDQTAGIKESLSNSGSHGNIYDLQGRRIEKPTHGLYIVNGKKVIIK